MTLETEDNEFGTVTPEMIGRDINLVKLSRPRDLAENTNRLHRAVFLALSDGRCEDVRLCAFVMWKSTG